MTLEDLSNRRDDGWKADKNREKPRETDHRRHGGQKKNKKMSLQVEEELEVSERKKIKLFRRTTRQYSRYWNKLKKNHFQPEEQRQKRGEKE